MIVENILKLLLSAVDNYDFTLSGFSLDWIFYLFDMPFLINNKTENQPLRWNLQIPYGKCKESLYR